GPVVNRHSVRGLGRIELPPLFFAIEWQEDRGTTADVHLAPPVEALSHDPELQSVSEPWRPMDRRRHHYRGSSLGRVPRPQKEALTPAKPSTRRSRHRLRPHLHLPEENQHLHRPGRTAARPQGGRGGNQLHRYDLGYIDLEQKTWQPSTVVLVGVAG